MPTSDRNRIFARSRRMTRTRPIGDGRPVRSDAPSLATHARGYAKSPECGRHRPRRQKAFILSGYWPIRRRKTGSAASGLRLYEVVPRHDRLQASAVCSARLSLPAPFFSWPTRVQRGKTILFKAENFVNLWFSKWRIAFRFRTLTSEEDSQPIRLLLADSRRFHR